MPTDDLWLLISAHRDRLYRIARRKTATPQDAEDVVQEAMLRAAAFDGLDPARLGKFLTSVTVRLCADLARRRAIEASALPRLYVPADDLEAVVLDAAEALFLASVPLTGTERTLLTARLHGLYPSEVAAGLGMTVSAAKSALRRARQKILAAWKATLGILVLTFRKRGKVAAPTAGTAVAVVVLATVAVPLVLHLAPPWAEQPGSRVVDGTLMTPADSSTPFAPARIPRGTAPPEPPVVPKTPRTPSSEQPADVAVPPLDVGDGTAGHRGVGVVIDDEEPLEERVARCLSNGVEIDIGNASVVCKE